MRKVESEKRKVREGKQASVEKRVGVWKFPIKPQTRPTTNVKPGKQKESRNKETGGQQNERKKKVDLQ